MIMVLKKDVWSTKANVADLLKDENITTRPQDVLNVALDTKLKMALKLTLIVPFNFPYKTEQKKIQYGQQKQKLVIY